MAQYPGSGKATLLNANSQVFLWGSPGTFENTALNAKTGSIAVQLERQKAAAYPFGFAVEIVFSATPGTFTVDVQGAEQDQDSSYVKLGSSITTVNAGQTGRFEGVPGSYYPKYVRVNMTSAPSNGGINVQAIITR